MFLRRWSLDGQADSACLRAACQAEQRAAAARRVPALQLTVNEEGRQRQGAKACHWLAQVGNGSGQAAMALHGHERLLAGWPAVRPSGRPRAGARHATVPGAINSPRTQRAPGGGGEASLLLVITCRAGGRAAAVRGRDRSAALSLDPVRRPPPASASAFPWVLGRREPTNGFVSDTAVQTLQW